jgi:hypothetical protein
MDLSKQFTDWDDEEIKLSIVTFSNWHNARFFGQAICKFSREDLNTWIKSLLPDCRDNALVNRYVNHLIIKWLGMKLVRSEGRSFIAMVGMVVEDEHWMICGERVDRIGLLKVLREKRSTTPFTFEHHKITRAETFEGAIRIAGFSVEDLDSSVPSDRRAVRRDIVEERERQRDQDIT